MTKASLRCPVCRASFRKTLICSRCGVDLEPLMVLAAKAYLVRRAARDAIWLGDFARAHELAVTAQKISATERGRSMEILTRWLTSRSRS